MPRQSGYARVFGPPERDGEELPRGSFARALVVDDDERLCVLLSQWLQGSGMSVRGAHDVAQARAAFVWAPQLVLVDVCLPDGSGTTVAREVAALDPKPVVVGMSGAASPEQTFDLARADVRAFLVKPFSDRDLSVTLREALVEHEIEETAAGRARPFSPTTRSALRAALDPFCEHHALSARQREIVAEILRGTPRSLLAQTLGVSENTCKTGIRRILMHCGVERTADLPAAVLAHRHSGRSASTMRLLAAPSKR